MSSEPGDRAGMPVPLEYHIDLLAQRWRCHPEVIQERSYAWREAGFRFMNLEGRASNQRHAASSSGTPVDGRESFEVTRARRERLTAERRRKHNEGSNG